VNQIGELQARSWMLQGSEASQQGSRPGGAPAAQSTPRSTQIQACQRQLGFSTTRA